MIPRTRVCIAIGIWLAAVSYSPAIAQTILSTITGTVTDPSGAVVPNTAVTVTNNETGISTKVTTGTTGDYVVPDLPSGTYSVRVEATGFRTHVTAGIRLLSRTTVRVDIKLETGAVSQAVEVTAAAPVLNTENATIGNTVESNLLRNLPVDGRNMGNYMLLAAGLTTTDASHPRIGGAMYWGGTTFQLDGGSYQDMGNGGAPSKWGLGFVGPSVEAISELKIDSTNQKAEYDGSASVVMITKSGTNEFHGSLFAFNRNRALASNNPNTPGAAKAPYNRNEFGGSIGGRIVKNRTFFFVSYEGFRLRYPTFVRLSTPTAAMRSGDYTGLPAIADPLAANREPFPGNRIPAARIDSRSQALAALYPLPTGPGIGPAGTINNYEENVANVLNVVKPAIRLDHRLSDRDTLIGNYTRSEGEPYQVTRGTYPSTYGHYSNAGFTTDTWNLSYLRTITPTTLNELKLATMWEIFRYLGQNRDFNPQKLFPDLFGPLPTGGYPLVTIDQTVALGDYGGYGGKGAATYTEQVIDNFTHIRGKHTIKAGVDLLRYRANMVPGAFGLRSGINGNAAFGSFTFNGRYTNNDPTKAVQPTHPFADFLLGYPVSTARGTATPPAVVRQWRYGAYLQDDWRISRKVVLSLGVRYFSQGDPTERDGTQSNFDFSSGKMVYPGSRPPIFASQALTSRFAYVSSNSIGWGDQVIGFSDVHIAPRLGVAVRPFNDSKTVLRAGAGIYHTVSPIFAGANLLTQTQFPFLFAETFTADPGTVPSLTLAHPFGTPGSGSFSSNPSVYAMPRDFKNATSQTWSFTVEREIVGNLGARISYVGNKTSHALWYGREANQPREQSNLPIQAQRPYQPWSSISLTTGGGDANLQQLQIAVTHKYAHGLTLQVNYAYNRSLDNVPVSGGPMNQYNNRADWGNSNSTLRHILTVAGSYELPWGPGKPFLNVRGPLARVLEGWSVSGFAILNTGTPLNVTFSPWLSGWISTRADLVGDPALGRGERSKDRWFNTSAFATPQPYTWGNSARNLIFGPGQVNVDVSFSKEVRIGERVGFLIRGDMSNFPNHSNLANPGTNISNQLTFGRVSTVNGGRTAQLGARLTF